MANALTAAGQPATPTPSQDTNALAAARMPAPGDQNPQGTQPAVPEGAPPAPSHAQALAAMRHFGAIRHELELVMKDPALGKTDVREQLIDGAMRLVAQRFMQPTEAVDQLTKLPNDPLQQMKWVRLTYAQATQAEHAVLDHYGAANPHAGTVGEHLGATQGASPPDEHGQHMRALTADYARLKR